MVRSAAVVALLDAAGAVGLVVVGSRGRGGYAGLPVGSVALQLAIEAPCPVAIIRGHDDRTAGPVVVGVNGSNPSRIASAWLSNTPPPGTARYRRPAPTPHRSTRSTT